VVSITGDSSGVAGAIGEFPEEHPRGTHKSNPIQAKIAAVKNLDIINLPD